MMTLPEFLESLQDQDGPTIMGSYATYIRNATLEEVATHEPLVHHDKGVSGGIPWESHWLCCSCGWNIDGGLTPWRDHIRALKSL